jgi:hypothetical protein
MSRCMRNRSRSDEELITRPEAYRRTQCRRALARAIEAGEIPLYDLGGWPRLRWSDVLSFIESTRRATDELPADGHSARESSP